MESASRLDPALWRNLLARRPAAIAASPLYGPLAAAAHFTLGRIAQSLDGRIATASGHSFWIGGPDDILHTHRLRALADAVVVGAATVRVDDPLLTTRHCPGPSPVRVVLDPALRLAADRRLFGEGPRTLILAAEDAPPGERIGAAEILRLPCGREGMAPATVIAALRARGLARLFVEGGGVTVSRFLTAGVLDRLHVTLAALLLGAGVPAFTLPGVAVPGDGRRLAWRVHPLGADLLFDIPLP